MTPATSEEPSEESPSIVPELLGEYALPAGSRFAGSCLGGLSGLDYDPESGRFFAMSDARDDARFFVFRVRLTEGADQAPRIEGVDVEDVVRLRTREGLPYPPEMLDPEGFAYHGGGQAWISSEGIAKKNLPPFIDLVDVASGAWRGTLFLPEEYLPSWREGAQLGGVGENLGFESLAADPAGLWLFAATEEALVQDAGEPVEGQTTYARLLRFRLGRDVDLDAEYLYPLETLGEGFRVNGLVDVLALGGPEALLGLERGWGPEAGYRLELFEAHLTTAAAEIDREALSAAGRRMGLVKKRSLVDLGALELTPDNYEGMAFGPALRDGSRSLIIVSDDNNPGCGPPSEQRTRFLLFRYPEPH